MHSSSHREPFRAVSVILGRMFPLRSFNYQQNKDTTTLRGVGGSQSTVINNVEYSAVVGFYTKKPLEYIEPAERFEIRVYSTEQAFYMQDCYVMPDYQMKKMDLMPGSLAVEEKQRPNLPKLLNRLRAK